MEGQVKSKESKKAKDITKSNKMTFRVWFGKEKTVNLPVTLSLDEEDGGELSR